jgi:hypothetical protein
LINNTLLTILATLAILGQLIFHFQKKGAEIILSPIGGFVLGVNYVTNPFEVEEGVEIEQFLLSISFGFVSITFIWYSEEEI